MGTASEPHHITKKNKASTTETTSLEKHHLPRNILSTGQYRQLRQPSGQTHWLSGELSDVAKASPSVTDFRGLGAVKLAPPLLRGHPAPLLSWPAPCARHWYRSTPSLAPVFYHIVYPGRLDRGFQITSVPGSTADQGRFPSLVS